MDIDLNRAVAAGELEVWYQPQVAARSLHVAGFEALARWNHPERGHLAAEAFLGPVEGAQSAELVADLLAFVLARACADAAAWPDATVGVNISPLQFADENFPQDVAAIAASAGLPLHRLELEILENIAIEDPDKTRAIMTRLRDMGVRLAIDDFGQGHSRDFLRMDLPVSKIKLARSLVSDEQAAGAIGEFVAGVHALGMVVTAEGVETREQALAMQAAGCDFLQGYFFGRPSPAAAIAHGLRGETSRKRRQAPDRAGACLMTLIASDRTRQSLARST